MTQMLSKPKFHTILRPGILAKRFTPQKQGEAEIVIDTPSDLARLMGRMHGQPLRAEKYARLKIGGALWMTDAEFECDTNDHIVARMHGDVLVAGLGLGLILGPALSMDAVSSVTVLEKSADVIALVSPLFPSEKLTVIHADVYKWEPTMKFDCIYFDIWPNVPNSDDAKDMKALAKRYRKSMRRGGWIRSWCEGMATRY